MIDSHTHINSYFKNTDNIEEVNTNPNIEKIINVGLDIENSKEIIKMSNNNKKMFASVGIHPLYINDNNTDDLYHLITDKVVAIGEIGLDNTNSDFIKQRWYLVRQIIIANELQLPVIIHSKNSNEEIINIFKNIVKPKYGCVFHCFQPDIDTMNYLITNGYYISFAGPITYKTAKKSLEIVRMVPNELFLVETDSPYMTPEPHREQPNSSSNLKYIISKIADIKDMSFEEAEKLSTINTKKLFKKMV